MVSFSGRKIERVRTPDDPPYDDQDFMELIRLIKGNSTYSKVCQDKSQATSLLFRVQRTLVGNSFLESQNEYQWDISTL